MNAAPPPPSPAEELQSINDNTLVVYDIGKSIMGTMMTTLLLAYSGGYIGLLMVFMAQGTPIINILNLKYVSAEILHTLIGSFGLITVAPFTAITSGIFLTGKSEDVAKYKNAISEIGAI